MWKVEIRNKKQEWVNFRLENQSPSPRIKVEIHAKDGRKWVQPVKPQKIFNVSWNGERFANSHEYTQLKNKHPNVLASFVKYLVVNGLYDFPIGYCGTFK